MHHGTSKFIKLNSISSFLKAVLNISFNLLEKKENSLLKFIKLAPIIRLVSHKLENMLNKDKSNLFILLKITPLWQGMLLWQNKCLNNKDK